MGEDDGKTPKVSRVTGNFNQVARDLHRAIAAAGFSGIQGLLLQQAQEESYTRAKILGASEPLQFRINFSAVARALDLSRENLNRQFLALAKRRVFLASGDGAYRINKDYREWLDHFGRPLLSPGAVRWCGDAPGGRRKSAGVCAESHTPCDSAVTPPVTPQSHPPVTPQSHPPVTPQLQVVTTAVTGAFSPPTPPVGERARKKSSIQSFNSHSERAGEVPAAPQDDGEPPFAPPVSGSVHPLETPPRVANDPAEVDRVAALAERLFPMHDFGTKVRVYAAEYPAHWVRAALDRAAVKGRNRWDYVLGVLRSFEERPDSAPRPPAPHVPPPAGPPGGYFTHDGPPKRYRKPGTPPAPEPEGIDS